MKHFRTITAPIYSFETHIERNDREYDVTVEYRILAGHKATFLTPAEPESVEIVTVRGVEFDLSIYDWDQLEQEAADDAREMAEDCRDADLEAAVSYSRSTVGMGL